MANAEHKLYKGLQRPLVFKMFKGKYIYWGVGSLLAGIVVGVITASTVSQSLGIVLMLAISVPLMMYTLAKQKKGLYDKSKDVAVFIIPSRHFLRRKHEKKNV